MAYVIESKNLYDSAQTRNQTARILTRYFGYKPKFRLPTFKKQSLIVPPRYLESAGVFVVTITNK